MAIPGGITADHVKRALARIDTEGIPPQANSSRFDLIDVRTNKHYPPKLVLSYAAEIAGFQLSRRDFSGGQQTNLRLEALGFTIERKYRTYQREVDIFDLLVSDTLTNDELVQTFAVGNSGGMRWSGKHSCLVLVADHTKGLYDDRWADDVLLYTGMGRFGDQQLTGQNLRLSNQIGTKVPVHLFEVFQRATYTYVGRVELVEKVRRETQPDDEGREREVLIFPLRILSEAAAALPTKDALGQLHIERERALRRISLQKLLELATSGGRQAPGRRKVVATHYQRSEAVAEFVKRVAEGKCDLCEKPAPFETALGPYLECHHIKRLADGGADTVANAVALCPNCHRRMHLLANATDVDILTKRVDHRLLSLFC